MMVIPREDDIVRLYTQLSDEEAREVLNVNGRVDMTKWGPEQLLEVSVETLPMTLTHPVFFSDLQSPVETIRYFVPTRD